MERLSRRVVSWFSCGAASTIATRAALTEFGPDLVIARIDTGSENTDQERYHADVEAWLDHEIILLKSTRYVSTWDVWEKRRFLNGPQGALCTTELKKMVRHAFQRPDDLHVFGYTADERDVGRAERSRASEPELGDMWTPLIEHGLTKTMVIDMVARAGLRLPVMYELGYRNNNCVPCVKGGMGYMNKIRRDFPDEFNRLAALEREIGHSCINGVFLDELDPDRGNYEAEESDGCDLFCPTIEQAIGMPERKGA